MSVTINAKGTSVPSFTVGKAGTTIYQNSQISAQGSTDLTLSVDATHYVNIDSGTTGPSLITTDNSLDLHINPAVGGGQYLVLCDNRWPTADGSAGQVIITNGAGVLSFTTLNKIGSPSPATTATTGFGYIPVTTGTPSAVPTAITGYVPMVADSSGNKLWIYINGTWKYTTLN